MQYLTWFPYSFSNCSARIITIYRMGTCTDGQIEYADQFYTMFPLKIAYNFHKCTIHVGVVILPPNIIGWHVKNVAKRNREVTNLHGIEMKLLDLIAYKLNFTPKFYCYGIDDNWGHVYTREVATGMFNALYQNEADVIIGTITSTANRYSYLDMSVQYLLVRDTHAHCKS